MRIHPRNLLHRAPSPLREPFVQPLADEYRPSEVLGRGCNKDVYATLEHGELVVRVLNGRSNDSSDLRGFLRGPTHPSRQAGLIHEHAALERIRAWGLPAAELVAVGSVDGRPADVLQRMSRDSKSLLALRRRSRRPLASGRAKAEYEAIARRLFSGADGLRVLAQLELFRKAFARGLVLPDFQLMFAPGGVLCTDTKDAYESGEVSSWLARLRTRFVRAKQSTILAQLVEVVADGLVLGAAGAPAPREGPWARSGPGGGGDGPLASAENGGQDF